MNNANWVTCYVGLGSNLSNELGSPTEHLQQAIAAMREHEQIRKVDVSSFYASAPMGPQDQPDFVNAVASFETTLTLPSCSHFANSWSSKRCARDCAVGVSVALMWISCCTVKRKSQSHNSPYRMLDCLSAILS